MLNSRQRATFDAFELAVALSHYDLGVIESITEFARGSSRSAKVGIVAQRGKFLLKRRASARAKPALVAFAHLVQTHLRAAEFPAPALVLSRDGMETVVQIREQIYELFEFVAGSPFRRKKEEVFSAGATLGQFHAVTANFAIPPHQRVPIGDYHQSPGVSTGLLAIGSTLSSHDSFSGDEAELASLVQVLLEHYESAGRRAADEGFDSFDQRLIHADWHPGNLLFRNGIVVAVVDYDSARRSAAIVDIANGALQFSMTSGGDPENWPDHVDIERFHAFLHGYESSAPLTPQERRCIPSLMIEALIAECVPPITATGSVGRWAGFRVLKMVRRKILWLASNPSQLVDAHAAG
jgi:Ser/Thr protein kinase RdoA (MazF antagonist)